MHLVANQEICGFESRPLLVATAAHPCSHGLGCTHPAVLLGRSTVRGGAALRAHSATGSAPAFCAVGCRFESYWVYSLRDVGSGKNAKCRGGICRASTHTTTAGAGSEEKLPAPATKDPGRGLVPPALCRAQPQSQPYDSLEGGERCAVARNQPCPREELSFLWR